MLNQTLGAQAQRAYDAAVKSPCPDWRAVVELFRAAMQAERVKRTAKPATANDELPDYNVDRVKLVCRSPRIAVRFMDGEAVFTHVPSAPGKPLNIGRALRVAIIMYRSRARVCRGGRAFANTIGRSPRLKSSKCAAWKRTNCSTWTLVTGTRLGNAKQRSATRRSDASDCRKRDDTLTRGVAKPDRLYVKEPFANNDHTQGMVFGGPRVSSADGQCWPNWTGVQQRYLAAGFR